MANIIKQDFTGGKVSIGFLPATVHYLTLQIFVVSLKLGLGNVYR